jgi:hypothetical protein
MKLLKKTYMLKKDDVVATISLSGGRAGDNDHVILTPLQRSKKYNSK